MLLLAVLVLQGRTRWPNVAHLPLLSGYAFNVTSQLVGRNGAKATAGDMLLLKVSVLQERALHDARLHVDRTLLLEANVRSEEDVKNLGAISVQE